MAPSGMRARLLVVDDEPDNLQGLMMILGQRYGVLGCQNALDALGTIGAVRPDLLILDILMRPMDGVSFLRTIRACPERRTIPAIAITAQATDADRQRFLTAGFQAVFTKPILDYAALFKAIEGLLEPPLDDAADQTDSQRRRSGTGQS